MDESFFTKNAKTFAENTAALLVVLILMAYYYNKDDKKQEKKVKFDKSAEQPVDLEKDMQKKIKRG